MSTNRKRLIMETTREARTPLMGFPRLKSKLDQAWAFAYDLTTRTEVEHDLRNEVLAGIEAALGAFVRAQSHIGKG